MTDHSGVVDRLGAWREHLARKRGGAGEPPSGELDTRLAALEAHITHMQQDTAGLKISIQTLQSDVQTLKVDVAVLKERVPSKTFVVQALVGGMAMFAAVIAFADQVRKLFGLH